MKIFNEQGFLNKEGLACVNEHFAKEARRILATATNAGDVEIIIGILKSIVEEQGHKVKSLIVEKNNIAGVKSGIQGSDKPMVNFVTNSMKTPSMTLAALIDKYGR